MLLENAEGALWTTSQLEALRVDGEGPYERVVVAIDPPVTGHERSDECGIVVVGVRMQRPPLEWRATAFTRSLEPVDAHDRRGQGKSNVITSHVQA